MTIAPSVAEPVSESSSDVALIETARKYKRAVETHTKALKDRQRRLMEDFWHLGEALSYLYKRHNPTKTWMKCLEEIGVNPTTAGHARKLFERTAFENLDTWKNKTQALHDLGILMPPAEKPAHAPVLAPSEPVMTFAPASANPARPEPNVEARRPSLGLASRSEADRGEARADAEDVEPSPAPAPPTARELLLKVVRALEEVGPVGADLVDLLDRAAVLIEGLRVGATEGAAA